MFTVLSRIIRFGFDNFWRSVWPSMATVAILVIALLVFLGLIFFNVLTGAAVDSVQGKIDVSVYFKTTAAEDSILNIKQALESLPEVKSVEYVSPDQALAMFKDKHASDPNISQAVDELANNPLEASLNIQANNPNQYGAIADYLKSPNLNRDIDKVSYAENKVVIERLIAIVNNVNRGGWMLTIILALISGLVVFNTVQLAIYSNRDEITIMRSVGASTLLVRGPYVVEGMLAGAIAAILSLIVMSPILYLAAPYFGKLIQGLDLFRYLYTHFMSLLVYQLLFGVLIGGTSSFIAVRRYLKN